MIKTYGDRQPGLGTSAIVGALTLAKTGTTARTATFPDAAITVAGSASALTSGRVPYVTTGGLLTDSATFTFSDPNVLLSASTNGIVQMNVRNTDAAGASAQANIQVSNAASATADLLVGVYGASRSGTQFGVNRANAAFIYSAAASITALVIGHTAASAPVIIGSNNAAICTFATTGITASQAVTIPNGTAAAPGLRTTTYAHGLYSASSTLFGVSAAGVSAALFGAPNGTIGGQIWLAASATEPGCVFLNAGNTSSMILAPGAATTAGGQVRLYGSTHASKASYVEFTRGATVSAYFDGSSNLTVNNTTDATTTSDGSVRLSGGLSVAKNIVTGQSALFTAATAAGTTAGQLQRETNQDKLYAYANGIGGWLDKCIFSQYASVTQSGIVTDQSLASATARGTRTLPANFFKQGKVLKFRLCGRYTTDAAAGNATIQIKLGTTVFRTSGSFALDNSVTNLPWELEGEITCLTTGASGTVEGISLWKHMITGATGNYDAEALAGTTSVTLDTTASQTFDVVWTADDAGTAITCTCFRLWEVC